MIALIAISFSPLGSGRVENQDTQQRWIFRIDFLDEMMIMWLFRNAASSAHTSHIMKVKQIVLFVLWLSHSLPADRDDDDDPWLTFTISLFYFISSVVVRTGLSAKYCSSRSLNAYDSILSHECFRVGRNAIELCVDSCIGCLMHRWAILRSYEARSISTSLMLLDRTQSARGEGETSCQGRCRSQLRRFIIWHWGVRVCEGEDVFWNRDWQHPHPRKDKREEMKKNGDIDRNISFDWTFYSK